MTAVSAGGTIDTAVDYITEWACDSTGIAGTINCH